MKANTTPVYTRACAVLALTITSTLSAQETPAPATPAATPTITINAADVRGKSSPILYGLMTEDINYCLDGGLYGELIANRTFQEPAANPKRWSLVQDPGASGAMDFVTDEKNSDNQPVSLKLTATTASDKQRVGIANEGYWGIPIRPDTTYKASFYAKADGSFTGPLTVALSSTTDPVTYATATVPKLSNTWQKYEVTLKTAADVKPTKNAQFLIWTNSPGTAWFSLVSLFPPTFNNRPNGMRADLMELLDAYHPAFLRFPGGNFLEGNTFETRFNWKKTLGDVSQRPGHMNDAWGYYSDDGVGLLEYLEWCEDLKMQPVLAVYAGLHLGGGRRGGGARPDIAPGPDLEPYVQDALDEIEYVTGDVNTKWGAQRAKDGHPAPFKLTYVEIGNEDWAGDYNGRFTQIYDAIKAKYPNLQIIDSSPRGSVNGQGRLVSRVTDRTADVLDSHLYTNSLQQSEMSATAYDRYDRNGPKVFEGEWATRVGRPTPNMAGALGDGAYMTGLERNSDIVIMASYAPLFVNVSNTVNGPSRSMQWPSDLIGFDALTSYGSPSYYAQVMFNNNRGDEILATTGTDIGNTSFQAPPPRGGGAAPAPREIPTLFYSTTRDSKTGMIYLKVVNPTDAAQSVKVDVTGVASVAPEGESVVLKGDSLEDTNSITDPKKIMPVTAKASGLGTSFTRSFPPFSITILKLNTK